MRVYDPKENQTKISESPTKKASEPNPNRVPESMTRPVGGTEYSWCRAITGGTGIAVIALLLSRVPKLENLQNTLNKLQIFHPTLRSNVRFDGSANSFSFVTSADSRVEIHPFDSASTAQIIRDSDDPSAEPHRIILEHEMNKNTWIDPHRWPNGEVGVFFVSLYDLGDGEERILTFRLNTGACDRTSAVTLLREFMKETTAADGRGNGPGAVAETAELGKAIEDLVPSGKGDKPFWARGIDVLGYSLNAFRFSNLNFVDAEDSNRRSQVVRLKLERDQTLKLVAGCKGRGLKLWAAIASAGLIAAYSSKNLLESGQGEKYAVVTLSDCRSVLEPPLTPNDFGFYHSGILHTHDINGEEKLWDLAKRCYDLFTSAKNSNKHFTDMSDLNFLMCKAIENPNLTPSSSLRTAYISIFEDPVTDEYPEPALASAGVRDYIGCASIHGVGPSVAVFDTLRDGKLDCAFVYPSPLHSREQMDGLIQHMKAILLEGSSSSF